MSGEIGQLARGSFVGLPSNTAFELLKNGVDTKLYLDNRGKDELEVLLERDLRKKIGCVECLLALPGLRQVREILPQSLKDRVKDGVKHVLFGDAVEP